MFFEIKIYIFFRLWLILAEQNAVEAKLYDIRGFRRRSFSLKQLFGYENWIIEANNFHRFPWACFALPMAYWAPNLILLERPTHYNS